MGSIDLNGYSKSVKKEIIAIHDHYLENRDKLKVFDTIKKRKVNIFYYLFLLIKS